MKALVKQKGVGDYIIEFTEPPYPRAYCMTFKPLEAKDGVIEVSAVMQKDGESLTKFKKRVKKEMEVNNNV